MSRVTRAAAVVAALLVWWLLWPLSLGGQTTYVSTYGVSMEPTFHTGDLAILRAARSYAVGDVVAYRSAELDAVVMHRVVAVQGGQFTFKGDNNTWLDPENPTDTAILGALAVRVPQGGVWLRRLASPLGLAVETFLVLAGASVSRRRRGAPGDRRGRRRRRALAGGPRRASGGPRRSGGGPRRSGGGRVGAASADDWVGAVRGMSADLSLAATGCALLALAAVVTAVIGWSGPATVASPSGAASVPRSLTFSYSARVPGSAVYDGGVITSPDPVFRRVTDTVDLHLHYVGDPGAMRVEARLATSSGWHSTVQLAPERAVGAGRSDTSVRLDLAALEGRALDASGVTAVPVSQLTVSVVPVIRLRAGGVFEPTLKLGLGPLQMAMLDDPKSLVVVDSRAMPAAGASSAVVPRTVPVLGAPVRVSVLRIVALALGPLAVAGALLVVVLAYQGRPRGERAQIRRLYGPLLVEVQRLELGPPRAVADVASMAALVRIAQRYGLLVLYWDEGRTTTYVVWDDATTYRYVLTPPPSSGARRVPRQRRSSEAGAAAHIGGVSALPIPVDATAPFRPSGSHAARHAAQRQRSSSAESQGAAGSRMQEWPSDWRLDWPR